MMNYFRDCSEVVPRPKMKYLHLRTILIDVVIIVVDVTGESVASTSASQSKVVGSDLGTGGPHCVCFGFPQYSRFPSCSKQLHIR